MPTKPNCPSLAGAHPLYYLALIVPKDTRKAGPYLCHLKRREMCIRNDCESSRKDEVILLALC